MLLFLYYIAGAQNVTLILQCSAGILSITKELKSCWNVRTVNIQQCLPKENIESNLKIHFIVVNYLQRQKSFEEKNELPHNKKIELLQSRWTFL